MQRLRSLHPDPRLAQACALLREVLDGAAADGAAVPPAGPGWDDPGTDPLTPLGPDLLGSDFRTLWQPLAPLSMGEEPWSAAWQHGAAPEPSDGPPASSYRHWQPPSDLQAGEGLAAFQQPFWTRSGWPEGHLRAADALAVADCLYDFVHALERFDVEAAMAAVADDFHQLQDDRELDRQGFRHWLEDLLDGLRGGEIDVSLTEVPRPVAYGRLALCETTLQIDRVAAAPTAGAVPSSLVLRLLLSFERDAQGSWRILTFGRLDEARSRS